MLRACCSDSLCQWQMRHPVATECAHHVFAMFDLDWNDSSFAQLVATCGSSISVAPMLDLLKCSVVGGSNGGCEPICDRLACVAEHNQQQQLDSGANLKSPAAKCVNAASFAGRMEPKRHQLKVQRCPNWQAVDAIPALYSLADAVVCQRLHWSTSFGRAKTSRRNVRSATKSGSPAQHKQTMLQRS